MINYNSSFVPVPRAIESAVSGNKLFTRDLIRIDGTLYVKCNLKSVDVIKKQLAAIQAERLAA